MSGHSKWSTIKHKKAATDAKRAGIFTRVAREITLAAAEGGGDPEINFRLRLALERAKAVNLPTENRERAIKRGTGEMKDDLVIEEILYEAYGPYGLALLIQVATDNRNRTLAAFKKILKDFGGKLAEGGGVLWQFEKLGRLKIIVEPANQEKTELFILESEAKDYRQTKNGYLIFTLPEKLKLAETQFREAGLNIEESKLVFRAKDSVVAEDQKKQKLRELKAALLELDDITAVYAKMA